MMRLKYLNKLTFNQRQSWNMEVSSCDLADLRDENFQSLLKNGLTEKLVCLDWTLSFIEIIR